MFGLVGQKKDDSRYRDPPRRMGRLRLRSVRASGALPGALVYVLGFVLGSWLTGGLGQLGMTGGGFGPGLGDQLSGGIAVVLADDPDSTNSRSPAASWRDGLKLVLMTGLATGLIAGLVTGLVAGLSGGLRNGLMTSLGTGTGLAAGNGLIASTVFAVFLAEVRMAVKWGTPIRMMRFLEDARSRNVLRTVGPVYQFRQRPPAGPPRRISTRTPAKPSRTAHAATLKASAKVTCTGITPGQHVRMDSIS